MQKLFKDKKIVLVSLIAVLVVTAVVVSVALNRKPAVEAPPDTAASDTTSDVNVSIPEIPDNSDTDAEESQLPEEIEDDGNALKPDESVLPAESKTPGDKADTDDSPVSKAEPPKPAENNASEIVFGDGGNTSKEYSCGAAKHHCKNADVHAYILNLELEGCPHCGAHDCPSFYALNEWGYTKYNAAVCPQYNVQKDLTKYCSRCGEELWSPDNPTGCFSYLQDTDCECGERVAGNTCHHH